MSEFRLKANFPDGGDKRGHCVLLVDPGLPDYQGERLKALVRSVQGNFGSIQLILDNRNTDQDIETAKQKAYEWLDCYRDALDEWGISLENMLLSSSLTETAYYGDALSALDHLYGNSSPVRKVFTEMATRTVEDAGNLQEMRKALKQGFDRVATLLTIKGLAQNGGEVYVVTGLNMPEDRDVFERHENKARFPNGLTLPQMARPVFAENTVEEPRPERPVFKAPDPDEPSQGGKILQFRRP